MEDIAKLIEDTHKEIATLQNNIIQTENNKEKENLINRKPN